MVFLLMLFFAGTSDNSYTHTFSGTFFPGEIGNLKIGNFREYDDIGKNISMGYGSKYTELTHYVYPAYTARGNKMSFETSYNSYMDAIYTTYKGAELLEDSVFITKDLNGRHSKFSFTTNFHSEQQEVFSYLFLFEDKGWFIKLRVTFPKINAEASELEIQEYIEHLPLPVKEYE